MRTLIFVVAAYLFGSIPSALIIGKKYYNKDIRLEGSGNLGGTNAGRVLGKKAGFIVTVADVLKVLIPTLLARCFLNFNMAALIGIIALIGHCYPVFAGFKGGKGVSSYLGIGLVLNPLIALIVFIIWVVLKRLTNYVSLSSMIGCFTAPFIILAVYGPGMAFYLMLFGALLIIYLHRSNIKRLINGTENRIRK
ncbi:MAG: glycerol-3-phosphate acyltransferase [Clostridiales bacterium]|jgi:glycerol-3-phosphate acyltransferase PlsY|nr:glycerol-3-phosphate acyltransferase [Clostridiales bacterium]